ncbi:unnamed protein product [Caenorhabditis bovis]|uniref:Uncharacterized protein n=1 Tax=Caenorhabditis bovis TaxID=2654633 RepID=A0A8S1EK97_9PELO|nr:unnamed protein product [Caenorhabditis bovis]
MSSDNEVVVANDSTLGNSDENVEQLAVIAVQPEVPNNQQDELSGNVLGLGESSPRNLGLNVTRPDGDIDDHGESVNNSGALNPSQRLDETIDNVVADSRNWLGRADPEIEATNVDASGSPLAAERPRLGEEDTELSRENPASSPLFRDVQLVSAAESSPSTSGFNIYRGLFIPPNGSSNVTFVMMVPASPNADSSQPENLPNPDAESDQPIQENSQSHSHDDREMAENHLQNSQNDPTEDMPANSSQNGQEEPSGETPSIPLQNSEEGPTIEMSEQVLLNYREDPENSPLNHREEPAIAVNTFLNYREEPMPEVLVDPSLPDYDEELVRGLSMDSYPEDDKELIRRLPMHSVLNYDDESNDTMPTSSLQNYREEPSRVVSVSALLNNQNGMPSSDMICYRAQPIQENGDLPIDDNSAPLANEPGVPLCLLRSNHRFKFLPRALMKPNPFSLLARELANVQRDEQQEFPKFSPPTEPLRPVYPKTSIYSHSKGSYRMTSAGVVDPAPTVAPTSNVEPSPADEPTPAAEEPTNEPFDAIPRIHQGALLLLVDEVIRENGSVSPRELYLRYFRIFHTRRDLDEQAMTQGEDPQSLRIMLSRTFEIIVSNMIEVQRNRNSLRSEDEQTSYPFLEELQVPQAVVNQMRRSAASPMQAPPDHELHYIPRNVGAVYILRQGLILEGAPDDDGDDDSSDSDSDDSGSEGEYDYINLWEWSRYNEPRPNLFGPGHSPFQFDNESYEDDDEDQEMEHDRSGEHEAQNNQETQEDQVNQENHDVQMNPIEELNQMNDNEGDENLDEEDESMEVGEVLEASNSEGSNIDTTVNCARVRPMTDAQKLNMLRKWIRKVINGSRQIGTTINMRNFPIMFLDGADNAPAEDLAHYESVMNQVFSKLQTISRCWTVPVFEQFKRNYEIRCGCYMEHMTLDDLVDMAVSYKRDLDMVGYYGQSLTNEQLFARFANYQS